MQLSWSNRVSDNDSIFIERRTSSTGYANVAVLKNDSTEFLDKRLKQDVDYYYRVIAHYNSGDDLYSQPIKGNIPIYVPKVRAYYLGEPIPIPGIVEAEDFDIGGEGLTYHDLDERNIAGAYRPDEGVDIYDRLGDGYQIGNAFPGEWCEYTLNITETGKYTIKTYLASIQAGGEFQIKIGDICSDTLSAFNSNSWLNTKPVTTSMDLNAGVHVMRFTIISSPQYNIDKFTFELTEDTTATKVKNILTDNLNIYRNQNLDLVIRMNNGNPLERVNVYNITGSFVAFFRTCGNYLLVPATAFPTGIYILQIFSGNDVYTRKIGF